MARARTGYIVVSNDLGASDRAAELGEEHYLDCIGLYVLSIGWCDRQRTDGAIPRAAMRRFIAPGLDTDKLVAELVRAGFFEETDTGWQVHSYLAWQRSREEIEAFSKLQSDKANRRWQAIPDTDGSTDGSAVGYAASQPTSHLSSQPANDGMAAVSDGGGQVDIESIVAASGGNLSSLDALMIAEEHGYQRTRDEALHMAGQVRLEGLQVKSWPTLLENRLSRSASQPASPYPNRRPRCVECNGTGKVPDFREDVGIVGVLPCPTCSGGAS